jgi:hypothetical protein
MNNVRTPILLALLYAGCASIQKIETTTNTPLPPAIHTEVVPDSVEYSASARIDGSRVRIAIAQTEMCAKVTTPRSHQRRYVARTSEPRISRTVWVIAASALGTGAYSFADAEGLANRADGPIANASASDYREYGGTLLLLGLAATAVGVIDRIRAADSEYDDGVIEGEEKRTESLCRHRETHDRKVALLLPNDHGFVSTCDRDGVAEFDLLEVPDEGLPPDVAELEIGGRHVRVDLSSTQREALRANLLAEPRSRIARDALAKRKADCSIAVDTARAAIQPEPASVLPAAHNGWLAAKGACTDLWTSDLELELVAVDSRILVTDCRNRLRSVATAFVEDTGVTVEEMTAELATLRDLCPAPEHVAQRRLLETKLASAVKRLERAAAEATRRAAREEARVAAENRQRVERARAQRSYSEPESETTWSAPNSARTCCKYCSAGKACGNSCIAQWKTCHRGSGCACDE